MNTDTDSADATDGSYVSIRSIRIGSVNASAEIGTVRIVSAKPEGSAPKFEKFQNSGADGKTVMVHKAFIRVLSVSYPYSQPIITHSTPKLRTDSFHADHYLQLR